MHFNATLSFSFKLIVLNVSLLNNRDVKYSKKGF